jgi:hypothetical protein
MRNALARGAFTRAGRELRAVAADVTLTTRRAEAPSADFAFEIDFKRGEGSASRVFLAINDFINGCERLDAELVSAIDAHVEAVMVQRNSGNCY